MIAISADLPILVRSEYSNNVSAIDLSKPFDGHVDIPRLREGKVGGFFWSVYVDCPPEEEQSDDFLKPTNRVRWVVLCAARIPALTISNV